MPPTFSKNFANTPSDKQEKQKPSSHASSENRDVRYIVAVSMLVVTVLFLGLLYGANIYFDRRIVLIGKDIENQGEAIQLETINDLIILDKQIQTLKDLAVLRNGYLSILREVSVIVTDGIQYIEADISLNENREYEVRVEGIAESPEAYLRQLKSVEETAKKDSDKFAKMMNFSKYVIRRDRDGTNSVLFTLTMLVPVEEFIPPSLKNTETL